MKTLAKSLGFLYQASPRLTLALGLVLIGQGLAPAAAVWGARRLVDAVAAGDGQGLALAAAFWVGALFLDQALAPLSALFEGNLNERLTAHLNIRLMEKINRFEDLTPFEDEAFYNRVQLLREQASYQPTNLLIFLANSARNALTLLPLLLLSATLGWWVPAALLLATLPHALTAWKLQRAVWETLAGHRPEARRMEYAASLLLDPGYAKEHRLFRSGPFWVAFYRKHFHRLHRAMAARRRAQLFKNLGSSSVSLLGLLAAVFGLLARRPSPGQVAMLLAALVQVQQSLFLLVSEGAMLFESLLYMQEFFAFLEEEPRLSLVPGLRVKDRPPEIAFEGVRFRYPSGREALKGVSFTLRPGELLGLVGENGAGKSTVVKLLLRFYEPDEGRILIDGVDLKALDLAAWRRRVAAVFQDFGRYALTLKENVALSDLARATDKAAVARALGRAGAKELAEKLPQGLETPLTRRFGGTELSGGEWQKVALARAFFREAAPVMILDEPTAALDPLAEAELYQRFSELARGRTTLLISHRLASVRPASRILVLKAGRVVGLGDHETLLKEGGEYARLWEAQSRGYRDAR